MTYLTQCNQISHNKEWLRCQIRCAVLSTLSTTSRSLLTPRTLLSDLRNRDTMYLLDRFSEVFYTENFYRYVALLPTVLLFLTFGYQAMFGVSIPSFVHTMACDREEPYSQIIQTPDVVSTEATLGRDVTTIFSVTKNPCFVCFPITVLSSVMVEALTVFVSNYYLGCKGLSKECVQRWA